MSRHGHAPVRAHAGAYARTREARLLAARELVRMGWAVADIARLAGLDESEVRRALRRTYTEETTR